MLTVLSAIGIILCIYVLISKQYKTKSIDVTLLFIFFNIIFTCKLWLSLDPTFTMTSVYIFMNYFTFIALCLSIIGVRKSVVLDKRSLQFRIVKIVIQPTVVRFKLIYKKILKTLKL